MIRWLRLAVARRLDRLGGWVRPPSPCAVRDWPNDAHCDGTACHACGTWEQPTGFYRPPGYGPDHPAYEGGGRRP